MVEMEGGQPSNSPLQISDIFQKFALAFRAKTYVLFADDAEEDDSDGEVTAVLLNSTEEFIPDQKVVVIKPEPKNFGSGEGLVGALVPSLLASVAALEASYLQFQAAHVPRIDRKALAGADESIVSILQKFNEMKNLYKDSTAPNPDFEFPANSFLEFQVQENQSKLRVLETIVNSLQPQIDAKDEEVKILTIKLDQIRVYNLELSQKLGITTHSHCNSRVQNLLTIRVFEAMVTDSVKKLRCFTKLLLDLMTKAGWDLEQVSSYVHSGVKYSTPGHFRYAFLSYVSLGMFQNFDKNDFGLSNGNDNDYWHELIQHMSSNPIDILRKTPNCEFSRFCQKKYEHLIHPTMESSILSNLEKVVDSWKSLTVFFEAFLRMGSSVWLLHKMAYAFDPVVEIFRVEKGAEYSMVYMEDVLGKSSGGVKTRRPRIEFTVIPGFKIGRTVIQSQVYVSNLHES